MCKLRLFWLICLTDMITLTKPADGCQANTYRCSLKNSEVDCYCKKPYLDYLIHDGGQILSEFINSVQTNIRNRWKFHSCEYPHSLRLNLGQIQDMEDKLTPLEGISSPLLADVEPGDDVNPRANSTRPCSNITLSDYRSLNVYLNGEVRHCVNISFRRITEKLRISGSLTTEEKSQLREVWLYLDNVALVEFEHLFLSDSNVRVILRSHNLSQLHSDGRSFSKFSNDGWEADQCFLREQEHNCTDFFKLMKIGNVSHHVIYLVVTVVTSTGIIILYIVLKRQICMKIQETMYESMDKRRQTSADDEEDEDDIDKVSEKFGGSFYLHKE